MNPSTNQDSIIQDVIAERRRQDTMWGVQNHDDFVWLTILSEEVGEVAEAILETRNPNGRPTGVWHES